MRPGGKKNRKLEKNRTGEFRIIAGEWRSRRVSFPEITGLRPTTDRVRETVFNWLNHYVPGARVLDLFTGSGSLAFEALSRGASSATCIELDRQALSFLKENSERLGAKTEIIAGDALDWLRQQSDGRHDRHYDVVFLDPPFRTGLLQQALDQLEESGLCLSGTCVYLEQEIELKTLNLPESWELLKSKNAGQVTYSLYRIHR